MEVMLELPIRPSCFLNAARTNAGFFFIVWITILVSSMYLSMTLLPVLDRPVALARPWNRQLHLPPGTNYPNPLQQGQSNDHDQPEWCPPSWLIRAALHPSVDGLPERYCFWTQQHFSSAIPYNFLDIQKTIPERLQAKTLSRAKMLIRY